MINVVSAQCQGWSCLVLQWLNNRLTIAPAIGGRIISLMINGHELLYMNPAWVGQVFAFSPMQAVNDKQQIGFKIIGGDKTWVAPQSSWQNGIPPVILDLCPYEARVIDSGVECVSMICPETQLQIKRRIEIKENDIYLTESFINHASHVLRHRGIWNVTQIQRPFEVYIPALKNGLRSYHHEDTSLPPVDEPEVHEDMAHIDCCANRLFKYGGMPIRGYLKVHCWVADGKKIDWHRYFDIAPNDTYAHQAAVEVFNHPTLPYGEVEVHAPMRDLMPADELCLTQCWKFQAG